MSAVTPAEVVLHERSMVEFLEGRGKLRSDIPSSYSAFFAKESVWANLESSAIWLELLLFLSLCPPPFCCSCRDGWRTHNSISHHHSFSLIIMVGRGRSVRGPKALSPKCLNRGAFFLQGRAKRLFPGCENFCLVLLWLMLGKTLEKAFFAPPCMDL